MPEDSEGSYLEDSFCVGSQVETTPPPLYRLGLVKILNEVNFRTVAVFTLECKALTKINHPSALLSRDGIN